MLETRWASDPIPTASGALRGQALIYKDARLFLTKEAADEAEVQEGKADGLARHVCAIFQATVILIWLHPRVKSILKVPSTWSAFSASTLIRMVYSPGGNIVCTLAGTGWLKNRSCCGAD